MVDTVATRLQRLAREDMDRAAFIFRGTEPGNQRLVLTRGEVNDLATAFSNLMKRLGMEPGQVVCNLLPNSPERVVTDLGIMVAGCATLNGMLYLADGADLAKILMRGGAAAIVLDPKQHPNPLDILGDRVIVRGENARSRLVPSLQKVFSVECGGGHEMRPWLEQLRQDCSSSSRMGHHVSPGDKAMLFNIAGTTAFSRLVSKTNQQLILMGETLKELPNMPFPVRIFNDRSLGWYNGCCCDYIALGVTRVLVDMTVPPKDQLDFVWESCLAEHCSVLFLLPPALSASLARPELWKGKKTRPRTIITGCQPMSRQQVHSVRVLCRQLIVLQGSAETGFVSYHRFFSTHTQHFEDGDYGKPVRGASLRLVNPDDTEIPPSNVGKPGEVMVKGPQVSNSPSSVIIFDGWMRTQQVAFYNARGNLQAVCLSTNAIIHGPYIIYYVWLEKRLEAYPRARKVVIVPVPDSRMFQEMCACIVPHRGEVLKDAELRAFCQTIFVDAPLECYHIPKHFLFFQDLPCEEGADEPDRTKVFLKVLETLKMSIAAI